MSVPAIAPLGAEAVPVPPSGAAERVPPEPATTPGMHGFRMHVSALPGFRLASDGHAGERRTGLIGDQVRDAVPHVQGAYELRTGAPVHRLSRHAPRKQ